jgi:hypothetical protein
MLMTRHHRARNEFKRAAAAVREQFKPSVAAVVPGRKRDPPTW